MPEIRDGEDLWQWSGLEISLNAYRRSSIPQKQFNIIQQQQKKTKYIFFLTNADILHKLCIFEISLKLCVYVETKRILLNENKRKRKENVP